VTTAPTGSVFDRIPLSKSEFKTAVDLLYRMSRISVGEGKEELIRSRLSKRVRALSLASFADYLRVVAQDPQGEEAARFVDLLTTNKTSFNRESAHFDYLRKVVLPRADARGGPLRLWSAGCSSGEEPYTLSMHLHEHYGDPKRRDALVLATDISDRVLKTARSGSYEAARVEGLKPEQERRFFTRRPSDEGERLEIRPELGKPLRFARLNLMGPWPVRGPFEAIFCRNVMIYFDRETREDLVRRFAALLHDGGTLFIGHSESLESSRVGLRYVQPSVYEK
jgi:chemotaxis protein methyltransferase CheR